MHYIISSLVTMSIWSMIILMDAHICKEHYNLGFFIKFACYGFASTMVFFLLKSEIRNEFRDIWGKDKRLLLMYIFGYLFLSTIANYIYNMSHHNSKSHSHIVIPITLILPSILAIIGTSLFLKEKIKTISVIGLIFIVIGSYILVVNNK